MLGQTATHMDRTPACLDEVPHGFTVRADDFRKGGRWDKVGRLPRAQKLGQEVMKWYRDCDQPPCEYVVGMLVNERLSREIERQSHQTTITRLQTQVRTVTKQLKDTETAIKERKCPPPRPPCPEPEPCPVCPDPPAPPKRWGVRLGYLAAGTALGLGGYYAYRQLR